MAAPPETLEALLRDELRAPVAALVRRLIPEIVAEELNGYAETQRSANGAAPSTKTCRTLRGREAR